MAQTTAPPFLATPQRDADVLITRMQDAAETLSSGTDTLALGQFVSARAVSKDVSSAYFCFDVNTAAAAAKKRAATKTAGADEYKAALFNLSELTKAWTATSDPKAAVPLTDVNATTQSMIAAFAAMPHMVRHFGVYTDKRP